MEDHERQRILNQLESGEINAGEALRRLEGDADVAQARPPGAFVPEAPSPAWRRFGWVLLFDIGLVVAAVGTWLATLGGWWWLLAAPLLTIGLVIGGLGLVSFRSPWVFIQIESGEDEWPRHFELGLPMPLRPAAWLLRRFGQYVEGLDRSGLDELLIALSGELDADSPIVIDVHEGEQGERVRVYFG
jgi:hypothetical protein